MITGVFIFLLFILPFVVIPFGISPFETYKVIAAEILIEILLFIKLVHPKSFKFSKFNKQQVFLVSLLISLIIIDFIIFQSSNFFGNPFRLQGILLLLHLLVFSLLSSQVQLKIPSFLFITSLIFLFLTTIFLGPNNNSRFFGPLGEPNALAATVVFIFPFIYFCEKLHIKITGILLTLVVIFLSGSRSGLIAIFIQILFILLSQKTKISVGKIFLMCLGLLGLSLILPFFENAGLYENRSMVWQTAFFAGLQSPFIGWGFGNIDSAIHNTSLLLNNSVKDQFVDSSHNFILDFFTQGGIIGLLIFGRMLFLSVRNLILRFKKMELAILLGLITAMSFNPVSIVTLIGFWWIVGQGFSKNRK